MVQKNIVAKSFQQLHEQIKVIALEQERFKSILIQLFIAEPDSHYMAEVSGIVSHYFNDSIIVGVSTSGEIYEGKSLEYTITASISMFETATLYPYYQELHEDEKLAGEELAKNFLELEHLQGTLLFATTYKANVHEILKCAYKYNPHLKLFGGAAGDYADDANPKILYGDKVSNSAMVAVAICGEDITIEMESYLGWEPLGKEMTITEAQGRVVRSIDNQEAFTIYQKYLGIEYEEDLFKSAGEFPLMVKHGDKLLARIPRTVASDGSLTFVADLEVGDKVRLGYGNINHILANLQKQLNNANKFAPEAIYLYSCVCRKTLMQQDIELETKPFASIAPVVGFFTYGEVCTYENEYALLNVTLVSVLIREGEARSNKEIDFHEEVKGKHVSVVNRLLHFSEVMTNELELMSITDKLTGLYNRHKLDETLHKILVESQKDNTPLCVVIADIDHFKQVNDKHGHQVGDMVLQEISALLLRNKQSSDIVGRLGGEEFLWIMPNTISEEAKGICEAFCKKIERHDFGEAGRVTISIGGTQLLSEDSERTILVRADDALYRVKNSTRNGVVFE